MTATNPEKTRVQVVPFVIDVPWYVTTLTKAGATEVVQAVDPLVLEKLNTAIGFFSFTAQPTNHQLRLSIRRRVQGETPSTRVPVDFIVQYRETPEGADGAPDPNRKWHEGADHLWEFRSAEDFADSFKLPNGSPTPFVTQIVSSLGMVLADKTRKGDLIKNVLSRVPVCEIGFVRGDKVTVELPLVCTLFRIATRSLFTVRLNVTNPGVPGESDNLEFLCAARGFVSHDGKRPGYVVSRMVDQSDREVVRSKNVSFLSASVFWYEEQTRTCPNGLPVNQRFD